VEDNEADVFLIEQAIAAAQLSVAVHVVRNGEQAIRFFDRADHVPNAPCPALVILDINLPRRPGYEVLKRMRTSAKCGKLASLLYRLRMRRAIASEWPNWMPTSIFGSRPSMPIS